MKLLPDRYVGKAFALIILYTTAASMDRALALNLGDILGSTTTDLSVGANFLTTIVPTVATGVDLQLSGTYTGGTTMTINGGTLNFGTLNDLNTTQNLTISNTNATAGSLILNTAANSTIGSNASDLLYVGAGGNLKVQSGAGTLTLNLAATGNIDNVGTLNLAGPINVAAGKVATFIGTGATTVSGAIAATTGSIVVDDTTGSVTLSGNNAYTGTTTINSGTLNASNIVVSGGVSNLGNSTTAVTLGGTSTSGLLNYTGNSATFTRGLTVNAGGGEIDTANAGQTLTIGTGAVVNTGLFTVGGSGNTTITSVVGGAGGGLTKTGLGVLTLNAADTYTGLTTVANGTLVLGNSNALGNGGIINTSGTGGTTINAGATVDLNGQGTINEVLKLNGTGIGSNGALINSGASATTIGSGVSSINVGGTLSGLNANTTVSIGAPTSGTTATATAVLGVTAGTFSLNSGAALYSVAPTITITGGGGTGATAVANLTLGSVTSITITNPGSGYTSLPTLTFSGGTLVLALALPTATSVDGQFVLDGVQVTNNGSGYTTTPTVSVSNGSVTTSANLTGVSLASNSSVGGSGDITINPTISGTGMTLTKVGTGTVTLGAAETYTGGTSITGGTLSLGVANAIANSTSLSLSNAGILSLGSNNTTLNGNLTLTSGSITGTGTLTASSSGTSYNVINGTVSAVLGGVGDTLVKATDGTGTGGTVILSGANSYTGATTVKAGILEVDGSLNAGSTVTIGGASATATPTLTGSGTINGSVVVASAGGGTAGTINPGGIGSAGTLTVGSLTLQSGATLSLDISGATSDLLAVTNAASIAAGAAIKIAGTALTQGNYVLATAASGLNSASLTVVGSLPSGYQLVSSSTALNLQHLADQTLSSTSAASISIIIGNSTPIGALLSDIVPTGSTNLAVNLSDAGGTGGIVSGLTSSAGTTLLGGLSSTIGGTLTATTAGLNETWAIKNVDPLAITSTVTATGTLNVYNHSNPTLTITSGNNQSSFVGGSLSTASLTLADTVGNFPAPLDVNTLVNLTGTTGSGVVATGGTGTYTSSALSTATAGVGKTLVVSLNAGDQQTIIGASPLSMLSQTITYNVYNHSTPTLSIGSGNNQSTFLNGSITGATVTLSDITGTAPVPLDVNTLSNLTGATGSGVVTSGGTGTYTATGFSTSTVGTGKTLAVSLKAGDQQSVTGANALSTLNQTITYNVYNHSTPTLSIAGGNNQSVFLNASVTGATVTLSDTTGTVPAPLDVNTLSNLTGTTGSGVIGSGSTGTYTATGFNTGTAGIGQSLAVSLKAGDQQSITGANALSTLGQTFTYNVYNHAAPTVTIASGNNQSGIVGSTLVGATVTVADTGTVPAPLDVSNLSNLSGATGSGVIASGATGSYTSSALSTATAGIGQTLSVSLKAGDQQTISGANPLSTFGQTITYNVYNHSAATLTIAGGNNQSAFVNGSITGATLTLADTAGTVPAPLDVTTLSNLTGSSGSGVIGSGSSGTYTATGFNTSTVGIGQSLAVSLKAGDQQTVVGANALSTLSQTLTYNVYNHSTPTFTIASGNNQSGIVGSTLFNATLNLSDLGTVPVPLDANTLSNLTGLTGSGVVASNNFTTYTSSALNTSTAGVGQSLAVSLKAGDQQSVAGANPLSTMSQTITYNIYNHSTPTLTIAGGNNQSVFLNGSITGATLTLADTTGTVPAPLDVNTLSNLTGATGSGVIGSNSSGTYTATNFNTTAAGIGKTLAVSLNAGDQQTVAGANALSSLGQTITYNVYNHSTPTLTIASGNNQSAIFGTALANATLTLADTGTAPAPLDVNTLSNLTGTTGSGVVASNGSDTYTSSALNTLVIGAGQTLTVSLKAGDQQSIAGANALTTLNQTITYNVYHHSAPTLTVAGGNNQSVFVNGSITSATLTLADTAGISPVPLDVNTLSNLTGATGSGVVGSGSSGTYTATNFNTSTAGLGQTLTVGLNAGDQQTVAGASALSALSQSMVYNVYNHSNPTLTLTSGNNQSGIVGSTLAAAAFTLADPGTVPSPLDVNTLSNLTGATGSGIIPSGGSGVYASTALNTATAGIGQSVTVSLKAGDQQTISGANPLSTLTQTITYNIFNHSTPTLTITSGNNQSTFVNGTLGATALTLADTTGITPAPLDVNTLSNLTGSTGSGIIGSGSTGTYTATGFNTSTAGIGQTLVTSLKAGDQQSITGASALSTLSQTVTYNVYNHATPTLTIAGGNNQSGIVGSTLTNATLTLADLGTVPAPLDVNTLNNLTGATGSGVVGSGASGTYTSTAFNTTTAGIGQTLGVGLKAGDQQTITGANPLSTLSQTLTYNIYNHSTPTLTVGGGNNQSVFVNGSITGATLSLADTTGVVPAPLDVNTLSNLTGATGSGVIGSGSTGIYTVTGFNTTTAGIGQSLVASLKSGDQQTVTGAAALSTLSQTITYNVYNHSMPTLAITTGNNQSGIIGSTLANATLSLADLGTAPVPLDVNTLSNLTGATGSGVVGSNSNGTYTSTALNTSAVGVGQSLAVSLKAGDQQTVTGANPLSTLSQTILYNIYNHSTPTLTIATGNNQSGIVGSTLSNATLSLADLGTVPAPLDVNTLSNLTGATGSGVVGSGASGTYTTTALNTSTAGIGKTLVASLNAGDQQTVTGANALSALSQTITYNVYNHSTPTLTIAGGNNQSVFLNGSITGATLTLADTTGIVPAPLDVNTLSNLTGATGSGVIASNSTGTYTATGFNTTTAGVGQTLAVSLKAGDQQTVTGASALAALAKSITYNVYNHSTPTLTIALGNNQSGIVGSTLANATLSLADLGTVPAPLDVNSLSNLTGATGSGVVGSGTSGTYTTTALNTSTAGIGQTLVAGLNAGDQQSISGANALSALSQTITYNVYNHSTPTLAIASGNNQSVFLNGTLSTATLTLADTGTLPAPLDVNTLSNLTGATGSGIIGSGSSGIYTVTGFNTSTAGLGLTLLASLKAGDQQTVAGASALGALSQTLIYNVYNHSTPTLTITGGTNPSAFVNGTIVGPTLALSDLGTAPSPLDVSNLTNLTGATGTGVIGSGSTGTYTATGFDTTAAGIGQTLGVSLKAGDEQSIAGGNPLSTLTQNVIYNIYNHATPTLTIAGGNNQSGIVGSTLTNATLSLADLGVSPSPLDVNSLSNLTGATGSGAVGSGSTGTYTATGFNTTTAGLNQSLVASLMAGDQQSIAGANPLTSLRQTLTYNVYNHSTPTLTISAGNNQSVFVNGSITGATVTLADTTGTLPAPLDVTTLSNLTGSTGSGVIGSGSTGSYVVTGFNTATAGIGRTLVASLKAGDQQIIAGASALSTLTQTIVYNVYNHSTPTLTITAGNNQSGIVGSTLANASLTLSDPGTASVPLDVSTLSNLSGLTGSGVVASGGSSVYTSSTLDTSTVGAGQLLAVSLQAGDQQANSGANALTTLAQTITYNVYNHSTPTLSIGAGNNQSVFVNGSITGATVTLGDLGTSPAPLDVTSLTNLTGTTGSGAIGSGATGTYTATGFNTTTAGLGESLSVGLMAGDSQSVTGANPLGAFTQTITYNVFNHAIPTLTITSGNNQSGIVGSTLANAMLTLTDGGTVPAPLDVNTLNNLTGATGSGVVSSGGNGTYTSAALNTATAGVGQTLVASLKTGDQQIIPGANPLSTLSRTITYNVYNHSTPTLTISSGNNQSGIVGSTLNNVTLTLADFGTVPAPLDVSTLNNLTGAIGSGVVSPGSTAIYTATPLNTATAGIGQLLSVSLQAGDQQIVAGANPLTVFGQTISYNVYNHSNPTFTIAGGNNQSVFVNASLAPATLALDNTPGNFPAPLDVDSLHNLTGDTGPGTVESEEIQIYTASGFNTSTVGAGKSLNVSLRAGDQQTIVGANQLSTMSQTLTYNVYNHATSSLSSGTLNLGFMHVGYTAPVTSSNSLSATNGTVADTRVNLQGSAPGSGNISVNNISGIASGSSGAITATLGTGQGVGNINTPLTYTFGDQSAIAGALSNVATAAITVAGQVYSGQSVWTGNGTTTGSWGSIASGFGTNWGAVQGSPGLDANFATVDTATFGTIAGQSSQTVLLNGSNPSLSALTFTGTTSYVIAQGSGGSITLNGGNVAAVVTDSATGGTQTISAPIILAADPTFNVAAGQTLTVSGVISGTGDLNNIGPGTTVLTAANTYTGPTTVNAGQLKVNGSLAAGTITTVGGASATDTPTLTGSGTVNGTVILSSANGGVAGTINAGGVGTTGTLTVGSISFQTGSTLVVDINGVNTDLLAINQAATIAAGAGIKFNASGLTLGTYVLATAASGLDSNAFTVIGSVPSGYALVATATTLDLQHLGTASLTSTSPSVLNMITGSTTTVTATLANGAPTGSAALNVNLADNGGTGGLVTGLTSSSGSTVAAGANSNVSGTLTAGAVGTSETWSVKNTDPSASIPTVTTGGTVNVYNHSTPTLTIAAGNNQSIFVNGTFSPTTLTLSDTGTVPVPLDVNTLSNVTGASGSGVVGSGASATYTVTGLNAATAGIGQTVTASLKAGDQQTVIGANALSTFSQTLTYNVYNHSTPTLTLTSGNNQSGIVGSTLANAILNLADLGNVPAPLDVNTLSNLTGTTGSGVVGSGSTGTYTSTALNTATAGVGKTLITSLKAGDQQSIAGANALATLSQTVTYNVYNHSTPTLTITSGNNQSAIVGSTLANAILNLADLGTLPAPLDVNTLNNLIGATGSGAVASGTSATYTSTPLNTSTAGAGQTLAVGLNAGDQQSVTGASPLSALGQTITYNVYNHSTPTLGITSGNNQSVFINNSLAAATVTLSNMTGTSPAPLDVNTLSNLTGATGSGAVASGGTGVYTATGFNTSTVGLNQTLAVSLKAGDQQTVAGASSMSTIGQTITYNVFNHATSSLTSGTLNFGILHAGYTSPVTSTNSLSATNGAAGDLRVNLRGSAASLGNISLSNLSGIASGGSGIISATLSTGQGAGAINTPVLYTFADQSAIAGASNNVGTATINVTGQVYSGQSTWTGNGTAGGSWGSLSSGFGTTWNAAGGTPGLDAGFTTTDTATFGNVAGQSSQLVTLDGSTPSLKSITFNASSTSYTIAQGTGGSITLDGGGTPATITDSATGGTQTISAAIHMAADPDIYVAAGRTLTISGTMSGAGDINNIGPGTTILTAANTYTGATSVNAGTFLVNGSTLSTGNVSVANGATLGGTGSVGLTTVAGGGNINLQNGSIGTLTVGSLNVGAAGTPSVLSFDIGSGSTGNLDNIVDNGAFVLNGLGGTSINVGNVSGTQSLTSGTYLLVSSTGITGDLTNLALARTSLDGKALSLDILGNNLYLVITDLTNTTTYSLASSVSNSRIMVNTGTTTVTSTITNTGSADTLDYTGLDATSSSGGLMGGTLPQDGGPVAANGGSASGTRTLSGVTTTGTTTVTPTVTSATNSNLGGNAILDSTTTATVDVVANRIVTATTAALGRILVGQAVNTTSTLSTTGDDSHFTRVTVSSAGPDANGISATGGTTPVFNDAATTDTRNVGGTFATAGVYNNNLTLTTTGEGLAGEAPVNVVLNYTADAVNKRVIANGTTTNLGTLHTGAVINQTSTAFTTSGTHLLTTDVSVAAGTGAADVNGVTLSGAATTFDGSASSDTRTFGGTISNANGGMVNGTFNLGVTTLENGGAGLAGEGTYNSVALGYTAFVYTGQGVWNAVGGGTWGTIAAPTNWVATGGAPGLDSAFASTDSATFGNSIGSNAATVTLNSDSPSLKTINFSNTMGGTYTIAQGSGGTLKLNNGVNMALVNNADGNNTISAPVELDSDTLAMAASGTTLTFSGAISDSGTPSGLAVTGAGTVVLGGANTYSGGTTVSSGTLNVAGAGTLGAPTGALDISASTLDLGGTTQTTGAVTITNASTIRNGTLHGASFTDSSPTGTTLITASLTGTGGFIKSGANTLILNGANTYSGPTTISAGTVMVGNLQPFGTGDVTFSGGTLEAGNGVNQINVGHDYTQTGGTLLLTLTGTIAGASNGYQFLNVPGTATLGGALQVNVLPAFIPVNGDTFHFVQAGNIVGGFSSQTSNLAILSITSQGVGTITINQLPFETLPGYTFTPRQRRFARYLDTSYGSGMAPLPFQQLVSALDGLTGNGVPPAALQQAFDQLSTENFHNFARETAFNNASFFTQMFDSYIQSRRTARGDFGLGDGEVDTSQLTVLDPNIDPSMMQMRSQLLAWNPAPLPHGLLSDSTTPVIAGVDSLALDAPAPPNQNHEIQVFAAGNVTLAQGFSQTDISHFDSTTGAVQFGADYALTPHVRIGALFAYSHTDGKLDTLGSAATIDSYAPAVYAAFANKGWYANALASYGFQNYTEDRHVNIDTLSGVAHGAPSGAQILGNLDGGYDFHVKNWTFGPHLGLQYTHLAVDSFSEDGSEPVNLNVQNAQTESLRSRLGGHVSYSFKGKKVTLTPHLDAFWQHEFLDGGQDINEQLTSLGGNNFFTVTTPRSSSDSVLIDGGLNADLNGQVSVYVDYLIQAGQNNYFGQSVQAGVRIGF